MSESSSGIMYQPQHADAIRHPMQSHALPYGIRTLNPQWNVLFLTGDTFSGTARSHGHGRKKLSLCGRTRSRR